MGLLFYLQKIFGENDIWKLMKRLRVCIQIHSELYSLIAGIIYWPLGVWPYCPWDILAWLVYYTNIWQYRWESGKPNLFANILADQCTIKQFFFLKYRLVNAPHAFLSDRRNLLMFIRQLWYKNSFPTLAHKQFSSSDDYHISNFHLWLTYNIRSICSFF